jgi:hypothetical protein
MNSGFQQWKHYPSKCEKLFIAHFVLLLVYQKHDKNAICMLLVAWVYLRDLRIHANLEYIVHNLAECIITHGKTMFI